MGHFTIHVGDVKSLCPVCNNIARSGQAIIQLEYVNLFNAWIGQLDDYDCESCGASIERTRVGDKAGFISVFSSVDEAKTKVRELRTLLYTSPKQFMRRIPLVKIGGDADPAPADNQK